MAKKRITRIIIIAALCAMVLNIRVPTKRGVDYVVYTDRIPLYIKLIEFIDRDYRYRMLARQIAQGKKGDKNKALAILTWVRGKIKTDVPPDWPVYDDHILNIIIRGYGAPEQLDDVFTALCAYSGLAAGWARLEAPGRGEKLVLSFVKIEGKWRVFDVYRGVYFINDEDDIASVEDIASKRYKRMPGSVYIGSSEVKYEEYFANIDSYLSDITLRARMQMPLFRLWHETLNIFKCKKTKEDRGQ